MSIASSVGRNLQREVSGTMARRAGAALEKEAERQLPKVLAQQTERQVPKVLEKGKPLLKLVLGKEWTGFLTREPLEANLRDVGPEWLTAISKRLDGRKREAVGLTLRLGANLPTPVPGITLLANASTEATLRRTPRGLLELVYATQVEPGVAAQLRAGLSGGFTLGKVALKGGAMAQAGVTLSAMERAMLVYEVNPTNASEMAKLATQLKGHVLKDGLKDQAQLNHSNFFTSMKNLLLHGKKSLVEAPKVPQVDLGSEFARAHLSQASFYQGVRLGAGANAWGGLSFDRDGVRGLGGLANGLGLNFKKDLKPHQVPTQVESWQKILGGGLDLFNSILTPSAGIGGNFDVGLEHTLDFDRGRYLKTTMAVNSDRSLIVQGGAYGAWFSNTAGPGHRYALTFGPNGLQGVDYSVRMEVGDGLKRQKTLEKQLNRKLDSLLPKDRKNDPMVVTYSLKPDALGQLKGMTPDQLRDALPEVFQQRDQFDLSRLVSSHGDRFEVGGWFGVGLGPFVGVRANVAAEHTTIGVRTGVHSPADPLPADRPWTLRQF